MLSRLGGHAQTFRFGVSRSQSVHSPVDICIVTQMHPSCNPRVVKEADALTAAGYSVAVIAPDYSAWGRAADAEFDGRVWKLVERPQFGPLSSCPARFVELARRAIAGMAVRHLGIKHPAMLHAAWHPVAPRLIAAAKRQPATLYIGHLAGLPAAAIAAAYHGTRYAFDAEDFHPGDLPDQPEYAVAIRTIRLIEAQHLAGCAYITAASPGIADAYAEEYGIARPTVILNTFPKSRGPAQWTASGSAEPSPSIYWFSQTIGGGRGIECAILAIARAAARPHLYLRGTLAPEFGGRLKTLARAAGVIDRLHILAPEPPQQMEALAARFDIALSGETGFSPNNRIALGNKLFTYLLAGVPILMSDSPAHQMIAPEMGCAAMLFPTEDAAALANAIDSLLLDKRALARSRQAAWALGQDRFNWEVDGEKLVQTVRRIVPSSSGSTQADALR
jgi:glycosyltransferase involved in cell wall biosynthesis